MRTAEGDTVPEDRNLSQEQGAKTIVVGVDGSANSRLALKWAADEAKRCGSLLRILYAKIAIHKDVPAWYEAGSSDLSPAEAIIDDAVGLVATRHPSVLARGEIAECPVSSALIVASRSADLLVVGARGLGGFEELLLGSVSDQCIEYAHCPVAIIHPDIDEPPLRAVEPQIVVGIDGSLGSSRALSWAVREAQIRSASVKAVYAWQYPPVGAFVMGPAEGFEVVASEIVDATTEHAMRLAPEVTFSAVTLFGAAVPTLLAECHGADLLVVGSTGHSGFRAALLGSTAQQCARHAKCAVIVARPHLSEEQSGGGSSSVRPTIMKRTDRALAPDPPGHVALVPREVTGRRIRQQSGHG
jgi:nucleotide-binding universal stress UspA family protein